MLSFNEIREDLKNIRYYYSRKDIFDKSFIETGENTILKIIDKYNILMRNAPIKLYDLYANLYINNNTQEVLADDLGWTPEYIQKLHHKLLKFIQDEFLKLENNEKGD